MSDSLIGSVVDGRYAITALIGRGGMATVYRARDKRLERDVAIKFMHTHLGAHPDFTERFNREARAAARLSSPYVVAVHDRGVWASPEGTRAYLVMEYVPGPDLRAELSRLGSFTLGTSLTLGEQVLRALTSAHAAGIVHRDVKPENIMLTAPVPDPPETLESHPDVYAKVTDFGLARAVTSNATATGQVMGTVAYLAPEVITDGDAGERADLYALGVLLYEFLTGTLPFAGKTPIATAYKQINDDMPRIADQADWLPPEVDAFVEKLTAKKPEDRPANAKEALDDLISLCRKIDVETLSRYIPVAPKRAAHAERTRVDVVPGLGQATQVDLDPTAVIGAASSEESQPARAAAQSGLPARQATLVDAQPVLVPPQGAFSPDSSLQRSPEPPRQTKRSRRLFRRGRNAAAPMQGSGLAAPQESGVAPAKSRKRIVVATALLLIVALIATAWYFMAGPGQRVNVPKVAGKSYKEAVAALSSKGLSATKKESYSDSVPSGRVLSTDPGAGTSIHPSTRVTVTVSAGVEKVEVPDLSGKTEAQAKEALRKARLSYEVTTQYSESVKKGRVVTQSSKAGAWVEHDSAVKITISGGREPIKVPKVVGMWKNDAVSKLEDAGFTVSIEEEASDSVAKDAVISQDPEDGESSHRHDNVTIKVSTGNDLVDVPNVLGKSTDDAESELKSAGFSVKKRRFFGAFYDTVNLQSPRSGKKAPRGSTVTIGAL
ncbi:hypothetical protein A4H34_08880 [Peptidiphaga gingivicola]|uniref:non-specific serine/threonine protein kinase n=1 Tax=Peptidiphaga gingivicola TaxID=2741497 RepID=A0A179B0H5_9ACTO|nr:Stk1 family PASTA domain-containing Ser/Thr kinase [Peptidiphaga gingivicola]OAP85216.1 hypothetical protein A4H34_08880 [Peptidiphaga gingivicola]